MIEVALVITHVPSSDTSLRTAVLTAAYDPFWEKRTHLVA